MKTDKMIDQLELYGNAITGFFVIQSLGFAYTLGSNQSFRCLAIIERNLNSALIAHFVLASVASMLALHYISQSIRRLSLDNSDLVRNIYIGKIAAVLAFAAIPLVILISYGMHPTASLSTCLASGAK